MVSKNTIVGIIAWLSLQAVVSAKKQVFAHYMVDSITSAHAATDIKDAKAIGVDAFALNVGSPTESYAHDTVTKLFSKASGTDFKLFFSFDLGAHPTVSDHVALWKQFKNHPNYYRIDDAPVVSTYGGYNLKNDLAKFKSSNKIYFIPNLDDANSGQGWGDKSVYYTDPSKTLSSFNGIADGYFSWESAWPASWAGPENISYTGDHKVQDYAHSKSKSYMAGLSTLQYKNCCGGHWYRIGETNLPERITEILDLKPTFTEVITWNDAGESHYVGNVWSEGWVGGAVPSYANDQRWPHQAWQPIITSFIKAFKAGKLAHEMVPPGSSPIGALWYRGVLKNSCSNPPANLASASDSINYAIVLPASAKGWKIRVSINDKVLATKAAQPGLNYAAVPGLKAGTPRVDVLTSAGGKPKWSAVGVHAVEGGSVACNFNFNVAPLKA